MNIKEKLLERLDEIGISLSKKEKALALLGLGSVGIETHRIDEYSDLDFFVICKEGFKESFISNLDWLESIEAITFKFKNTKDGYKLLFNDGVFCEFAIFEPHELINIPFSKGRIVWKSKFFNSEVCIPTVKENKNMKKDMDFLIGEALTNLYVGLGRYRRGEKLSAYNFIQNYAKDRVLELITMIEEPKSINEDIFSIDRRFEFRYPNNAVILSEILLGYEKIPKSAEVILNFLDSNFAINKVMKDKIMKLL
ncbi:MULTISPECIES: hypothetical protein [unclassified Clostridium]|uniref:hypothetical protein n=1 Tax=unclassified Clostridium TaxID=2614128 RepID=UPI000297BAA9|nr:MULTISPECIES: hypothetical protein [unclassified Clostridium]EKQ57887.1 MAG: hypothetical protein A370_00532 [Clostridium sp. Maddingley MBC34-26]